jgi:Cu(I)/Ag(I) efflux system membrane fusion protein
MKKTIITAVLWVVIGLGAGWFIFRPSSDGGKSGGRRILLYRDPMNPQNTSPTPKKAPDGMDYVPVYAEESGAGGEKKIAYYKDPMHPWFTSDKPGKAPDCGMDLVPVYEGESEAKGIKIDPVTVQNIGVKVEEVAVRKLNRIIRAVGRVQSDETKVYSINTKIMGWVEKLYVDYTGKPVRKGEPLLELYSPELVSTQEEYLQALRYQKQLEMSNVEEARKGGQSLVESARRRLLNWDIPESEISELERRGQPKKTMMFYSPADGYVMDRMVYKGQSVMAGMELYRISDLSTVWVLADVYQYELPWVKTGQKVSIELSYLPGKKFQGRITYVYPMLNIETKTARVRVEVRNTPSLELKPEMFATVEISSPTTVEAVAVPEQAIIHSGERNIAVIALGGGYFDPREVTLGVTAGGYVQVLKGVKEGEKIVVSSQFLIDSESNLKAAISQMAGHAGMDMSKPMDEAKPPAEGPKGHDMNEMSTTPDMKQSKRPDMKHMPDTKEPSQHQLKAESREDSSGKVQAQNLIDPVCGMEASGEENLSYTYNGKKYYFCSPEDMEKFKGDPGKYVR